MSCVLRKRIRLAAGIRKRYPIAAEKLCQRAQRYNEGVAPAQEYAKQGNVLIVAPDETCGVDTLKKDKESLRRLYEKGYTDGKRLRIIYILGLGNNFKYGTNFALTSPPVSSTLHIVAIHLKIIVFILS